MKSVLHIGLMFILGFTPKIQAQQTLHLIMIGDTNDNSIGLSCDRDLVRISNEANTIAKSIGYEIKKTRVTGGYFNISNTKKAIEEVSCKSTDIILFYYSGHGIHYEDNETQWPDLNFKDSGALALSYVYNQLKEKGAQFTLVLADCCNESVDLTRRGLFEPLEEKEARVAANYQQLFSNAIGSILASGAIPGQLAYGNNDIGGFFTSSFLEALQYSVTSTKQVNWHQVMEDCRRRTVKSSPMNQTPQYYLALLNESDFLEDDEPLAENENQDEEPAVASLVEINAYLNDIANKDVTSRKALIDEYNQYFEEGARVDVYKNTTLVDRVRIKSYLQKIYLDGAFIENINLIESKSINEDGKFSIITVQEIR